MYASKVVSVYQISSHYVHNVYTYYLLDHMAASNLKTIKEQEHCHYTYTTVQRRVVCMKNCSEEQNNRIYKGFHHCCYIEKFPFLQQYVRPRTIEVPLSFIYPFVTDLWSYEDAIFRKKYVDRIFNTSEVDEDESLNAITMYTSQNPLMAGSNVVGQVKKELLPEKEIESGIKIPHTQRLYDYVCSTLDESYIIKVQQHFLKNSNSKIHPENVTGDATSKADLLIVKDQIMNKKSEGDIINEVEGLVIQIENDNLEYSILERFKNMSDVAASLASQCLRQGVLINSVTVYGIVAKVNDMDDTRLIKFTLDFENGESHLYNCKDNYPLHLLLNVVVASLG